MKRAVEGRQDRAAVNSWLAEVGPGIGAVLLVAVTYGPAVKRYFTSEDFLLLRFLAERPPWQDLASTFGKPWLGVTVVKFYRPVATLLFALEGRCFGADPRPFNLVHIGFHAANTLLVAALARRLDLWFLPRPSGWGASWAAAVLFAVYPLHPNAVLFLASFATPFATAFLLLAAVSYLRHRQGGCELARTVSVIAFALALGSYELAVVLPALLATAEVLAPEALPVQRSRVSAAARALAPHVALTVAYVALRRAIFGVFLGGYEEMAERLTGFQPAALVSNLAASVLRLALPIFDSPHLAGASAAALGLVVIAPSALYFTTRRRLPSGHARLSFFAALWAVAFMAPFSFVPVVPGNGRYWYAVIPGVAIGLVAFARWLAAAFPRFRIGAAGVPLAMGLGWLVLLAANIGVYRNAGGTARAIQTAVLEAAAKDGAARRFIGGYPLFLTNDIGIPLAQVYHYGLADAVRPPFVPAPGADVAPLPPLPPAALAPLERLPGVRVYMWLASKGRLHPLALVGASVTRLYIAGPADGAEASGSRFPTPVVVPPGTHRRLRLVLIAVGNPTVVEAPAGETASTLLAFPREFVLAMGRLYPGRDILWWVVAEDEAGAVIAVSELRRLRPI